MKDRLKQLRKKLNLTQQEFANKLKISRSNIASYETGKSNIGTSVISLICREFNVNEDWIRTGTGEMFCQLSKNDEFLKATETIIKNNDVEVMSLLIEYCNLNDNRKEVLKDYLRSVSKRIETFETTDNS